jgi:hypothetical protein
MLLMYKSDPEIGTEFPETEKLIVLPKIIVPGQLNRNWQFTRAVECWHTLCSEQETTPCQQSRHHAPQA